MRNLLGKKKENLKKSASAQNGSGCGRHEVAAIWNKKYEMFGHPIGNTFALVSNENWMKKSMTSLEPRSERSSPYFIVSESRF